jgi:hypothetical protein
METKWFSQAQAHGGVRYQLFKRNTKMGAWGQTPYFVDCAPSIAHYTCGKKYGLYGSGMGELVTSANVPYRIAACFGGYSKLSEAKKAAEHRLRSDMEDSADLPSQSTADDWKKTE